MGGTWVAVVWAGFVASILAAFAFWLFRTLGLTRFSPTAQLGCLLFDDPRLPATDTVGFVLFVALGSTLLAALYAALMRAVGGPGWGPGLLVGAVHGAMMVGALPWLAKADRCVRMGRVPPPGRFGLQWGKYTPAVLVAGCAVYGGILGAVLKGL
jgi:hypothetical protein